MSKQYETVADILDGFGQETVKKYLKLNGYDGLFDPGECGCRLSDLFPCGYPLSECKCEPGYLCLPKSPEHDNWIAMGSEWLIGREVDETTDEARQKFGAGGMEVD